jgi:hypothetical protein
MKCPVCRSKFCVDDCIKEGIKDELVELAAFFGEKNWVLFNEYCDCFRPGQWGSVGEKKKIRLLTDIRKLLEKGEFEYDGKRYCVDKSRIIAAIRAVVDAEKYGFKNHNYLKKVMLGGELAQADGKNCLKPKRLSAEGMTAAEETARERQRAEARDQKPDEKPKTLAEFKRERGVQDLAELVGQKID